MIILDLDDTIFETKTIHSGIFDSSISVITNHYQQQSEELSKKIVVDLWSIPVDVVFKMYQTPQLIIEEFYYEFSKNDFKELEIETFVDYPIIHEFNIPKILVTSGIKELQNAKIDALGIRNDFKSIYIDDPRSDPRKDKLNIFTKVLNDANLHPEHVWVIGDNPDSEIKAGNQLGMKTIQRKSKSKQKTILADYCIDDFKQLRKIIT